MNSPIKINLYNLIMCNSFRRDLSQLDDTFNKYSRSDSSLLPNEKSSFQLCVFSFFLKLDLNQAPGT